MEWLEGGKGKGVNVVIIISKYKNILKGINSYIKMGHTISSDESVL